MPNKLHQLIITRRSIRLFKQKPVSLAALKRAVNAGRLAPSAANLQFIEYLVVNKPKQCEKIFPLTRWAGYLYPKRMPPLGKRPTAYTIILANQNKSKNADKAIKAGRWVALGTISKIISSFED